MTYPLVETKLLPPRPRARPVSRPRLEELVERGSRASLTLVAAPAGFGKTSLLAGWLTSGGIDRPTGWVSLDERDRDAATFWTYVLSAIDRAAPGTATAALAELQSHQVDIESVLTGLLNELSVLPEDIALVLDDFHLADGPCIRAGVTFLLDHLPPQLHVVISTRADPALPLTRMRARGELVEVRAADLRFTAREATSYLNDTCDLRLEPAEVTALEARTEGWVAALQLAALSLRGREDASQFIAGFAGDDRFVVDYLADEVLDRQAPDVRRFLLDSSVLDRLTAPLCDAVTLRADSAVMLESLERQNLFLIPLDRNRRWYRYHHLFADVLRARLVHERPGDVAELHRRAGDWFDSAGEPDAAVRHALAAGDVDLAADRVELGIPAMLRERREDVVCRWVDQLPSEVVAERPVLAVGLIGGLMSSNRFEGVDHRLRDVERLLAHPTDVAVVDHRELARLPAAVETYRAALGLVDSDLPDTVEHAEKALALAADDDHLSIAAASAVLGLVTWTNGDLEAAHRGYRAASAHLLQAGHIADVVGCAITLADIEMTLGRFDAAEGSYRDALALTTRHDPLLRGTADMYVGLSRVSYERGDLPGAADLLRRADELGEAAGLPRNPHRWRVAIALLRAADGDTPTAIGLLDEAERVYVGDFAPNVQPIPATRARMQAAVGQVTAAQDWARRSGLSTSDDLTYLREYEHVTLARVLLADAAAATRADGHLADVAGFLDRLLDAAETGGRVDTVTEVLVLQALAWQVAGQPDLAAAALDRAVGLAEPEARVRVFTDVGPVLAGRLVDILRTLARSHRGSGYLRRLREAAAREHARRAVPHDEPAQLLVDPLSSRELDVLRLLRSDLDGPSIARELGVSLATVRTHTQHIFAKLGVNSRRAAVRRAHQLNLFSRASRS
jgi:LuxR family maltose regulon positive regulatory protein